MHLLVMVLKQNLLVLELTHNWDQKENYDKGNGWGHICIETRDVIKHVKILLN